MKNSSLWTAVCAIALLISFFPLALSLTADGLVLLDLKEGFLRAAGAKQMSQSLDSWKETDASPCNWTGISCHFPELTSVRSIDLAFMNLGGIISPSIAKLQRLRRLSLHHNSLHGSIPSEIGNCPELRALYLRGNYLKGSIPPEIGHLSRLIILDLSSNLLKGPIPATLCHLTSLRFLNLSTNFLSGEVPDTGAMSTFKNTSFMGNSDLCGRLVQKPCGRALGFPAMFPKDETAPSIGPTKKSSHYMNGVLIGSMTTVAVALLILLCVLWACLLSRNEKLRRKYLKVDKKHGQDSSAQLVKLLGELPYPLSLLSKKLEVLEEEGDVIGSGGVGCVYKMSVGDSATYAVKKIEQRFDWSGENLEREVEILCSINHINLVKLRGYCRLPSARYLIYDYLAMGSLDHHLHEKGGSEEPALNWNTRLKIALGSARGLTYLHHDCSPRILHMNIKSSNILLDRSLNPHISDFGLTKLLVDEDAHVTTVVAGSFGYLAPEYLNDGQATDKSDVYSFGVLLLELATGKRPTDPSFVKKGLNIVGWINTLSEQDMFEDVVDPKCSGMDVESVEAVLDMALMCTEAGPNDRPTMARVLKMLEELLLTPCPSDVDF
ncbi:leucine-rich repeat protein kinase family protein isoform X2 [Wolffia australiana]